MQLKHVQMNQAFRFPDSDVIWRVNNIAIPAGGKVLCLPDGAVIGDDLEAGEWFGADTIVEVLPGVSEPLPEYRPAT